MTISMSRPDPPVLPLPPAVSWVMPVTPVCHPAGAAECRAAVRAGVTSGTGPVVGRGERRVAGGGLIQESQVPGRSGSGEGFRGLPGGRPGSDVDTGRGGEGGDGDFLRAAVAVEGGDAGIGFVAGLTR
jgi:hypothetical protein